MANNRRGRPQVRSVRRPTFWEGARINHTLSSGSSFSTVIVSEATLENTPNPTIVRSRGDLIVTINSAGAVARANFTAGLIVVTADALAAGAVPSPLSDIGSDWLWWNARAMNTTAGGRSLDNDSEGGIARIPVDSKAMRKVGLNQVMILVTNITPETLTVGVDVTGVIRVLLKR